MNSKSVVIIGAGISGLVAAIELEAQGIHPLMIEASDSVGGRVRTLIHDGYPLDAWFQVLLTAYPAAARYLDYDSLDLCHFKPGAVIVKDKKYERFGDFLRAPDMFLDTLKSSAGTISDKLITYQLSRTLKSKSLDSIFSGDEISTNQYLRDKGFSQQMITQFFQPFYGGIFLDRDLSTSSRMFEFTFKMFSEGSASIPKAGMQSIAHHLHSKLNKTETLFNTKVESYHDNEVRLQNGETLETDIVIDTCGALSEDAPMEWYGCKTHYFYTSNNTLNSPIIALVNAGDAPLNTFHFVSDVVGRHGDLHVLSATSVGNQTQFDHAAVKDYLETNCGLEIHSHIHTDHIEKALPKLDEIRYSPPQTSHHSNVIQCGDITSNASLNGAMESGAHAAANALSALSAI